MPDKFKPPTRAPRHIGATCARQMRTFADLSEKLRIIAALVYTPINLISPGSNSGLWVYFSEKRNRHSILAISIGVTDLNRRIDLRIRPEVQRSDIVPVGQRVGHVGNLR
jgi:hypothetical protein